MRLWHVRGMGLTIALAVALFCVAVPSLAGTDEKGDAKAPKHVTPKVRASVERGLDYLRLQQERDGSWTSKGAFGVYPVAMTSLAGLALLAHGDTPAEGKYAPELRRAVDYILARAEDPKAGNAEKGVLITTESEAGRSMYGHGFGMLFLSQVHARWKDKEYRKRIEKVLSKAVTLTVRSQQKGGGWYYTPDPTQSEGSVTVTQAQALRACRDIGVPVPEGTMTRCAAYVQRCAQLDGGIAYKPETPGSRPAITAAALVTLRAVGKADGHVARKAARYARQTVRPEAMQWKMWGHCHYAHFYLSQALYVASAKKPEPWDAYYPKIRDLLLGLQVAADGSWKGKPVGTVYGTSIACLILQLPYNTLLIMQR